MNEPLENAYFNWLSAKAILNFNGWRVPTAPFHTLFHTLHSIEFVWLLAGDDNRAEDGKELRREFLVVGNIPDDEEWRKMIPCSVLEMLIAFAERAQKNSSTSSKEWFWEFLYNLHLDRANDSSGVEPEEIMDTVELFMFRNYREDGDGGLFPLADPTRDQTEIEIWWQFCDYLVDQNRLP